MSKADECSAPLLGITHLEHQLLERVSELKKRVADLEEALAIAKIALERLMKEAETKIPQEVYKAMVSVEVPCGPNRRCHLAERLLEDGR